MWQFWVTFLIGLWLLLGQGFMKISISKGDFEVLYLLTGIFSFTLGLWLFFSQIKGLLKVFFFSYNWIGWYMAWYHWFYPWIAGNC
jgi:hypothetical protein